MPSAEVGSSSTRKHGFRINAGDALPLAAGEFVRVALGRRGEPDHFECRLDQPLTICPK
jgi:hypothetical protein